MTEILRASLFHTPRNPFLEDNALHFSADGAVAIHAGRIAASGDYTQVRQLHPHATVRDLRGCYLLPGFIDTHVHYPQVRILGGLGYTLLDWLAEHTLPEEARMADPSYAHAVAAEFVHGLLSHGTTTALVFGAHFPQATAILFETAAAAGVRMLSGLVLSDRMLRPELHQTPEQAHRDSEALIARFHGHQRLSYAVTPRFALSTTEPMLEVCQALLAAHPSIAFQTHINENRQEIDSVARCFPWAPDYLGVYEKFNLLRPRSVFAHNIHTSASELQRLALHDAAVSFCPSSNAALGSGFFPLARHLRAGVKFALGTDVGGGTGFGMLKEGLQAYLTQRLSPEPFPLTAAHLLYLATRAGALALGLDHHTGDLSPGKAADFVLLRPPQNSTLESVLRRAEQPRDILAALFTLAGAESVHEVRIEGDLVFSPEK